MKYKWIIMKEMEEAHTALPYKIVETEEQAEQLCYELESKNDGFIYWTYMCEEE